MGCNYYLIEKSSDDIKQKLHQSIDEENWSNVFAFLPKKIHIGKSSAGWKFCFNHNNWQYFDKSLESMTKFIDAGIIEDEYGKPISSKEFWEFVKAKEHGIDNREYYTNWGKYNKDFKTGKPLEKPSCVPNDFGQEDHFGLYFADTTEFS